MRIAIVGSGISGLVCAHLLHRDHELAIFEAAPRLGGHTNTVRVRVPPALRRPDTPESLHVDTGFIVFNRRTYPNFCRLIDALGVPHQNAAMSFSVSDEATGLEYGGEGLNGLFAQRRNLVRADFLRLIRDIFRFAREAPAAAESLPPQHTLGQFLADRGYSDSFARHYLIPMGAAIWSSGRAHMRDFPLRFFVRFFDNHGMLMPGTRPQWLTIAGGAQRYIDAITPPFADRIRLATPVLALRRTPGGVELVTRRPHTAELATERFDHAILACHSDQALAMLENPTPAERDVLGALPYAANDAVLHADARLMPRARRAWAAWNYHLTADDPGHAVLTYNMTRLQSLPLAGPLCVTLNRTERIDPQSVLGRWTYHHPQFSVRGIAAQARYAEVSGVNRTSYAGAYWFNGFHEDGVRSALRACEPFGVGL